MRVLQVLPRIAAQSSGPSHSVTRLSEALVKQGAEVDLHVLEPLPDHLPEVGVHSWPTVRFPGAWRVGWSPQMNRGLKLAAQGADIVHNHSLWMMPNIYCHRAATDAGCKLVFSPRGTLSDWAWQRSRGRKRLVWWAGQRRALFGADLLHATSEKELEEIRALGLKQPVAVIPNGVDLPPSMPGKQCNGPRTLLFLSRIHPAKNVDQLLRAWKALEKEEPDWRLQIAGPLDGDYPRQMQKLASELDLKRAEFLGELTGSRKSEVVALADLFVLPTHTENFGMVVAEALAHGTPVVVTKGAPWGGVVEQGCGWWIENGKEALRTALARAMKRPGGELAEMGKAGRAWMRDAFAWSAVAKQMADTYRWLLGQQPRPDCAEGGQPD